MKLYTKEFGTMLENSGYENSVKQMYSDHNLALESKEIIWYQNTFDKSIKYCKVIVDAEFVLTKCNQNYLEKIEDGWKISNISKSVLSKN